MEARIISKKAFKLQKEAVGWAKDQKKRFGPNEPVKWETNRLPAEHEMNWEAVIYKEV